TPNPFTPNGDGVNDRTGIRFALGNLNTARDIEVEIFDLAGRKVWSSTRQGFGQQEFAWDGRDDSGATVTPGIYVCKIRADIDAESASNTSAVHLVAVAY
ncbi:MAG: gliding motility-associated C-terminal domain-containing protein, partial [Candidatus Latescibacteria bacterium]|nr:gliding motility-associated C-terminal domain-containing protein [Candidatus Latescibacterota bacterium]